MVRKPCLDIPEELAEKIINSDVGFIKNEFEDLARNFAVQTKVIFKLVEQIAKKYIPKPDHPAVKKRWVDRTEEDKITLEKLIPFDEYVKILDGILKFTVEITSAREMIE